jgi:glycosyltransferase involved in cell wall biosynthesis
MKILQIVHGFPPKNIAGTEVYTHSLSSELAKNHEVFVFHRVNDWHASEYEILRKKEGNLNIVTINNTFRLCNTFEDTYQNDQIAEKFSYVLDEIMPDIVHIQHLLYLSITIIKKIKERRLPIVFTLQDYWMFCPQGQLFKKNLTSCQNQDLDECADCVRYQLGIRRNISSIYHFFKQHLPEKLCFVSKNLYLSFAKCFWMKQKNTEKSLIDRIFFMREICSQVDLFIAPSEFIKNKFIEFGIREEKIKHLPYGIPKVDVRKVPPAPSEITRFGFIGNLLPAKGVHILIQSFNAIDPDRAELKIYGRASSYKSSLENYKGSIKKAARHKNIHWMGGVDNEEISRVLKNLDILIVPSLWDENSPLVIQEAFLAKVPVIASRLGGIPELVKDNINGLLFKAGDARELRLKIQEIIKNPGLILKLKTYIPPVESIEDHAKKIEEIYTDLIREAK